LVESSYGWPLLAGQLEAALFEELERRTAATLL